MMKNYCKKLKNTVKEIEGSIILAGVFVVVFIFDRIFDGILMQWGSFSNDLFQNFQFWRLFTVTYLHSNLLHLTFNTAAILLIGYTVEKRYGTKFFLLLFFASDFVTSLIQWLMPGINATGGAGASCGIFGLLAALIIFLNNDPKYVIKECRNISVIIRALAIIVYIGSSFINALTLLGHLTGFAAGTAITAIYLIICFYKEEKTTKQKNAEIRNDAGIKEVKADTDGTEGLIQNDKT